MRPIQRAKFINRLRAHDGEIGQKTADTIREYHMRFVEPRLQALEHPWRTRWFRIVAWYKELRQRHGS